MVAVDFKGECGRIHVEYDKVKISAKPLDNHPRLVGAFYFLTANFFK